jgi:RNA polymerase sporulation-specific sigma factor
LGVLWVLLLGALLPLARGTWLLFGYMSGGAFPRPLGAAEEARLLALRDKGGAEAREALIAHNLRLVAHLVKRFDNTGEDAEDLISIGVVGLIKAVDTYAQDKGTRLATYAAKCISNEILMHLRTRRKLRSEVSLFDPVGVDHEGNEVSLAELLPAEGEQVDDAAILRVETAALPARLEALDPKERTVVRLRFGLGDDREQTQKEIARHLGISRSYVSRIEKGAPSNRRDGAPPWDALAVETDTHRPWGDCPKTGRRRQIRCRRSSTEERLGARERSRVAYLPQAFRSSLDAGVGILGPGMGTTARPARYSRSGAMAIGDLHSLRPWPRTPRKEAVDRLRRKIAGHR